MSKGCKASISILGLSLLIIPILFSPAWGTVVFGPKDYVRGNGAPKIISDSFSAAAGEEYKLEVYNGGVEDAATERVSASVIYLNNELVVGTNDFNQGVNYIERILTLQADNTLLVEVRSKPGGKITVRIESTDTTPPVVFITSPADSSLTNQPSISISGTIDDDSATVEVNGVPATLSAGTFITEGVPLSEGVNTVIATATDSVWNTSSHSISVTLDTIAPVVAISNPVNDFLTNQTPITVTGTVDDDTATVSVNGVAVTVSNGTFTATGVSLTEGANAVTATAADPAGNEGASSISITLDTIAPTVAITDPADGFLTNQATITVTGTIDDDTATVAVNGVAATVSAGTFTAEGIALTEGANTITATATDPAGNVGTSGISVALETAAPALYIGITSPSDGDTFNTTSISVTGNIGSAVTQVTVNGIIATISGDTFSVEIGLSQGNNIIEAVASDDIGGTATDAITVIVDSISPQITISSPSHGQHVTTDTVDVQGFVNESVSSVLVNGISATIDGLSFSALGVPLSFCEDTIEVVAEDLLGNSSSKSITVFNDSQPPPVTEESGYLVGYVYEAGSETPIAEATVTIDGICGAVQTDVDGRYAFPVSGFSSYSPTRTFNLTLKKEGYTHINKAAKGRITKEEAVEPIYLTSIDPQVTTITSLAGGVAVNSRGDTEVVFPPGSVPTDIDVTITMYDSEEQLPAPLSAGRELYAIGQFDPEGMVFNESVMVRLPNIYNMPVGTAVPCIDYDPETKTWHDVGDGIVSDDGRFIDLEVQHFSWYGAYWIPDIIDDDPDYPKPDDDDIEDDTNKDNDPEKEETDCDNSAVSIKRGSLEVSHSTASYKSIGANWGLTLHYDSSTALPQKVISYNISGSRNPKYTRADITGFGTQNRVYRTGDEGKYSLLLEAKDINGEWLKSGVYAYALGLTNYYDIIRRTQVSPGNWVETTFEKSWSTGTSGKFVVNNQAESTFGAGWQLGGVSKLIKDIASGPVIIDDSGKTTLFESREYWIDTIVGGGAGDGGDATQASLAYPYDVAVDAEGNLYIGDTYNHRIRKVDTSGIITTVAGNGVSGFSGDGGDATQASLKYPSGVAVDAAGNIYFADKYNHRIRKVDTNGIITTVAGNGSRGFSGDGGDATQASLKYPFGVAVDAEGNLYIGDTSNHRIRKVDTNGIITTVAGNGVSGFSGDGGDATQASLKYPFSVAVDAEGNLYIADRSNNRIRKVDTNGIITTVAGNGSYGFSGDGGPATQASLKYPFGVAVDAEGNLYIGDTYNNRIRKVDTSGIITTVAGNGSYGFSGDGGDATQASLKYSYGVAVDAVGNIYFADAGNYRIRKVDTSGIITTVAGQASLDTPEDVAVDAAGNIYIADGNNNRIRKVDINGIITTVAGNGSYGFSGDGGPATQASLKYPWGVAVDTAGNIYIADRRNYRIRKVDTNGIITTVAGNGSYGFSGDGGPATQASLKSPSGVAVDAEGNIYIADYYNQRIRKVDTNGIITTVAGSGDWGFSGDGGDATQASLYYPYDVAVDAAGNIYIGDYYNRRIRKVDTNGIITTVAGNGSYGFYGDGGPATQASLKYPWGVAVDAAGNIYFADKYNRRVRKVDTNGIITTAAGNGSWGGAGDGGDATQASLRSPRGVAVDADGNLYIADRLNDRIRICSYYLALSSGFGQRMVSTDDEENILILYEDGSAELTLKNGVKIYFDEDGFQTTTVDRNGNTTAYEYDENGRLIKITDPVGLETILFYGVDGKLDTITNPSGRATLFNHDANGNLISITDSDGAVTSYAYDERHLLTGKTGPNNQITTYNYNAHGQIEGTVAATGETRNYSPAESQGLFNDLPVGVGTKTNPATPVLPQPSTVVDGKGFTKTYKTDARGATLEYTDPLGNTTLYERDEFSKPTRITRPDGTETSVTYDERGNLLTRTTEGLGATTSYSYSAEFNQITSITDPLGNVTSFEYDANGNLIKFTDTQGNTTAKTYYSNGLVETSTDTLGNVTTYQYDPSTWQLTKVIAPDLSETTYTYDTAGNVLTMTDAQGKVTSYTYDDMNRVSTTTDATGGVTSYTYSPACGCPSGGNGNLESITDAEGRITSFAYNEIGQLISRTNPLSGTESYTYDANRNRETITDANGQVTTFTYDDANRLISKSNPTDTVQYEYDTNGRMTRTLDNDSELTMEYDTYGRLTNVHTIASLTQPATTISYTYDIAGRRTSMTDPTGTTTYTYDTLGRLVSMLTPTGQTITFDHDTLGRRTNLTLPNGVTTSYSYDNMNRLTNLAHMNGATEIDFYAYTYDNAGNRISMTEPDGTHNYTYDSLYRLVNATHPQPINPTEQFNYDAVGNRLDSHLSTLYTYNNGNRLEQDEQYNYFYDANGNMTSKTDRSTSETTYYTYDAENRLTGINTATSTVTYACDPKGRRIEKNVDGVITRYIYDGEDILFEVDGSNTIRARFTHGSGIDEPLIMERDGQSYYYLADGLGSIVKLVDSAGNVVNSYVYDSFGNIVEKTEAVANFYTYTGREYDTESGLYYYRARYYDASIGRFLSEDPLESARPLCVNGYSVNLITNIVLLPKVLDYGNLYQYVGNNPINYVDPEGKSILSILIWSHLGYRAGRCLLAFWGVLEAVEVMQKTGCTGPRNIEILGNLPQSKDAKKYCRPLYPTLFQLALKGGRL